MRLQDALDAFVLQLEADGRSPHTIGQYRRHVAALGRWLGANDDLASITPDTLARFLTSPVARTRADGAAKKATSANALRTSVRAFFAWCAAADLVSKNPARLVRRARCGASPPRALSDAEVARLEALIGGARGAACERDRVFVRLLLASGIRLGSALGLDIEDIDFERSELSLRTMKNDRAGRVLVSGAMIAELREFVAERASGPLFVSAAGDRLGRRSIQRRVTSWLRAAGVNHGASVHSLRHTCATRLYQRTGDVMLVREALLHRSIVSTTVYARADERRLRAAIR